MSLQNIVTDLKLCTTCSALFEQPSHPFAPPHIIYIYAIFIVMRANKLSA